MLRPEQIFSDSDSSIHCMHSEPNLETWAASDIDQKECFFQKKGHQNFTTPYSIPFLSVLHENKSLHNFHEWGQRPAAGRIEGLD